MRLNKTDFARKCQHPLLIASGTFPLGVLLVVHTAPEKLMVLPLFALLYVGLTWICLLIPGRWRLLIALAGCGILGVLAFLVLPLKKAAALLAIPAGYGTLLLAVMPVGGWSRETELSPVWHVIGLVLHIVLQVLGDHAHRTGSTLYEPAKPLLMVAFLLFAALAMMRLNRSSLNSAAQSRVRVPVQMRRQNILLTIGLLTIAVLLAALPAIGAFLRRLWEGMLSAIAAVAGFFVSLLSGGGEISGGGDAVVIGDLGSAEITEPGMFSAVLEKILIVLALTMAAFLLVFFLRKAIRWLRKLVNWIWKKLASFGSAAMKDYEDEITDTRDEAQHEPTDILRHLREKVNRPDESRMTPNERVRYRYLRLRMKHKDWKDASTARDTLPHEAARLYERARYGAENLTEEEAQQFRKKTNRV